MASCSSVERVIVTRRGSPKENGGQISPNANAKLPAVRKPSATPASRGRSLLGVWRQVGGRPRILDHEEHRWGKRRPGQVPSSAGSHLSWRSTSRRCVLNQRPRWLIRATYVGVLLLIPQLAWASQRMADPAVRVSDGSPFSGGCGLAGQLATGGWRTRGRMRARNTTLWELCTMIPISSPR